MRTWPVASAKFEEKRPKRQGNKIRRERPEIFDQGRHPVIGVIRRLRKEPKKVQERTSQESNRTL
jgi:hypothetical protein